MGLVERWLATRRGFKPRDVEEAIDFYWHRPLAGLLVDVIKSWPVTPNQVTFASAFVALLSGLAIGLGGYHGVWWSAVGGVLLLLAIVLDCADGQLARIKGLSSPVGRILDGTMDAVSPLAVFHGMAFFLLGAGQSAWVVWPIGWVTAVSLIWHANLYDMGKNVYLHCSRPDFSLGGDTLFLPDEMRRMQAEFAQRGERWNALLMRVWLTWTAPQVSQLSVWRTRERTPENDAERELFRGLFHTPMRWLTWLGFGTHLFVLTLAAVLAPLDARVIWVAWGIILGPLNAVAIAYAILRPRRERAFLEGMAAMRGDAV